MKILFDHAHPFALAHGGVQIQIEQTKAALAREGVEVDFLRWWDDRQKADLIHFVGRAPGAYIEAAHRCGCKVVMAELLTATGSRTPRQLATQRYITKACRRLLPASFKARLAWDAYQLADASVALTPWEAQLMTYLFDAPAEKVHVVPNGVEEVFFQAPAVARGPWLVCTATITERKRVLELAQAAVQAQTPVWIIGKAYADSDPYAQQFFALAKQNPRIVRYEGPIQDRAVLAGVYRAARGVVLLSTMESLSLSALEAAACESPLLLSDLPWARTVFGPGASYCPITSPAATAEHLRKFYDAAPGLKPPARPLTWTEVARQFKTLYQGVLARR